MRSKGQSTADLPQIAMGLVLVGVTLTIGIYIMSSIQSSNTFPTETLNFSRSWINNTWYQLPYRAASVSSVANQTYTLTAGTHYTVEDSDPTTRVILHVPGNPGDGKGTGATYNVTYAAYNSGAAMALQNASSGISTLGAWIPLIALVIAAGVIIVILVGAFA